ncbi:hypothetical protein AAC387_Pa02g1286 [Persea americana]
MPLDFHETVKRPFLLVCECDTTMTVGGPTGYGTPRDSSGRCLSFLIGGPRLLGKNRKNGALTHSHVNVVCFLQMVPQRTVKCVERSRLDVFDRGGYRLAVYSPAKESRTVSDAIEEIRGPSEVVLAF